MASVQVWIDDFDPLFAYSDYTAWQTPNPQDNPTWWNATRDVTGSVWYEATWHYTTLPGQKVSLNFTGSAVTLYGAGGPTDTSYSITLDPFSQTPFTQTYSTPNVTDGRTVLFQMEGLNQARHTLELENLGSGLLLDAAVITVPLGAEGATLQNSTVQNDDAAIQYSGQWTTQSGPNFNGGTSTYTSGPNNQWQFSFEGSAIYIYGDQVNDHGLYSIYLNGTSPENLYGAYNGRSGCGGGYAKYCEKLHGLTGFIGGLPEGTHTVTLINGGPADGNVTFYDFDYIEYTVPSAYLAQNQTTYSCPFTNCTESSASSSGSASGSASSSGASRTSSSVSGTGSSAAAASSSGAAGIQAGTGGGALGLMLVAWMVKMLFGW